MHQPLRRKLAPLLVLACLAGCTGSREDRINAAFPIGEDLEAAHAEIVAADQAQAKAIEAQYRVRLEQRAQACAGNYKPSAFASTETIRTELDQAQCFADEDAKIARWLGLRGVAAVLALPPLRPQPAAPVDLVTGDVGAMQMLFARAAGVAALQWQGHVRIVDLGTGEAIRDDELDPRGVLSLSDNGRVLVVAGEDAVLVRAADTGEVLATLPGMQGPMHWVGDRALVFALPGDARIVVRELDTGTDTELPFDAQVVTGVLPVAGKKGSFVLLSPLRVARLDFDAGKAPRLSRQVNIEGDGWGAGAGSLVPAPDGHLYVPGGTGLHDIDLATLEDTTIDLSPLRVLRVVPTATPGELLVGTAAGHVADTYLFSTAANTLARVPPPAGTYRVPNLQYVPSLKRNVVVAGGRVAMVARIDAEAPRPANEVIEALAFEVAIDQAGTSQAQARMRQQFGIPAPPPEDRFAARRARAQAAREQYADRYRAGRELLDAALASGVLRVATQYELDQWKAKYVNSTGLAIPDKFEFFAKSKPIYVITKRFTMIDDQTGDNSHTYILGENAPYPDGGSGHSAILDLKTGGCTGRMCSFLLVE